MAEVFKAKSYGVEGFEKVIAIKRILPSMCEDQDFIRMFIDEAKIAGQLSHANVCQIFELGRVKTAHFIAMEYIWGRDLLQIQNRARSRNIKMPIEMACFVIAQVCEGLDYAHLKKDALGRPLKIIHRDCSPQNILVSYEGEVKIIDFGIAKAASRSSRTNAGVLKGKFGYMSPEQVRGLPLDRRSDIFAIGTCLYESLTGARLFLGESDFSTLERVRNADVKPPRHLNRDIPPEVEAIVMKALARDPDERYHWCGELRADLQRYLTGRDEAFTAKVLSTWMRDAFADELAHEKKLMDQYKKVGRDGLIAGLPQAQAKVDVVSELGEGGDPEGDPTVLGGPSIEEMLAEAERRFSAKGRKSGGGVQGFGDDNATDIAGEVQSEESEAEAATQIADISVDETVSVDDLALATPRDPPPSGHLVRPGPGPSPAGLRQEPRTSSSGLDVPLQPPETTGSMAVVSPSGSYSAPRAGIPTLQSGQFGLPTDAVAPASGYPLPSAGHLRRRPSLLRDIGIGIVIAAAVLGLFVVGNKLLSKDGDKKTVAPRGALAILAADGKPAKVFVNGAEVGESGEGRPLTLEGLAPGNYTVELRREGVKPCLQTVAVSDGVEVVSCRLAESRPAAGSLRLEGIEDHHRIFLDDIEISRASAKESVQLEPNREHRIEIRVRDSVVQEFRVKVAAGEKVVRTVVPAPKVADAGTHGRDDKKPRTDRRKRDPDKNDLEEKDIGKVVPKPIPAAPKVGYLTASTRPWARILINGRDTGKMTPIPPRTKIPLKPGKHRVTFIVDGRKFSYSVNIEAGKTTHIKKSLGN